MAKKIYDNITMLAPDGQPLCRVGQKRANWYLNRNLADIVCQNPLTIKLNFEPAKRSRPDEMFYVTHKKNVCVVCEHSVLEDLTKHHIVPYCFRQHFPDRYKSRNHHDVVILCEKCHRKYERIASLIKRDLAIKYNKKVLGVQFKILKQNKINRLASAILKYGDQIPTERKKEIYNKLSIFLDKKDITQDDLIKIEQMNADKTRIEWHEQVVKDCKDIKSFIKSWRRHFVENMKPQYMPEHWDMNK